MNRLFECLLLTAIAAHSLASPFQDCGSFSGEVTSVEVPNCTDEQRRCEVKKGSQVQINIKFNSKIDTKSLTAVCHRVIFGGPMSYRLPNPDACQAGVSCPVKSGESYIYSDKWDIEPSFPPVWVGLRYQLRGEKGDALVCVEIPFDIV